MKMEKLKEKVPVVKSLRVEDCVKGKKQNFWVRIASTGLATPIVVPVMVARGLHPGPVVGLTAAVHGNELNGISVIQRLFAELDPTLLHGTVVGALVVNVPGFLLGTRKFNDGTDLNHIMPGGEHGNQSNVYAHRVIEKIVKEFDYLLDLHTASFGRVNSYYIRADMRNDHTRGMANLQNADIIVHNPPTDGTLRGAAADLGIHAITLEVGDPHRFQKGMIRSGQTGIYNLLIDLGMIKGKVEEPDQPTVICRNSFWTFTGMGGILSVPHEVTDRLVKGTNLAVLKNIFGEVIERYVVPEDSIVIGKSIQPVNQTGGRIAHLGQIANPGEY